MYYNNLKNVLVTHTKEVLVIRQFGHPFLLWNTSLQSYLLESFDLNSCYLIDIELRRLHRRFNHPSAERLQRVLNWVGYDTDKKIFKYLTKYYHYYQKYRKSPRRFRFTLRKDIDFNYYIVVDIIYISRQLLLYIVDEGTRFQASRWLKNITAKYT
jgi:hypothetical protein